MSAYNFTDEPTPTLTTALDAAGSVVLKDGSSQGDHLTETFSGSTVSVSIKPPAQHWQIAVNWDGGQTGVFPIPDPGDEHTYSFNYQVTEPATGSTNTGTGQFKIRKEGSSGG